MRLFISMIIFISNSMITFHAEAQVNSQSFDYSIVTLPADRSTYTSGNSYLNEEHLIVANNTCGKLVYGYDSYSLLVKVQNSIISRNLGFKTDDLTIYKDYNFYDPIEKYKNPLNASTDYTLDPKTGWLLFRNLKSNVDYKFYFVDSKQSPNILNFPETLVTSKAVIHCQNKTNTKVTVPFKTMLYKDFNDKVNFFAYAQPEDINTLAKTDGVSSEAITELLKTQLLKKFEFYQVALSLFGKKYKVVNGSIPTSENPLGLPQTWGPDSNKKYYRHLGAETKYGKEKTVRYDESGNVYVEIDDDGGIRVEQVVFSATCDENGCVETTFRPADILHFNPDKGTYSPSHSSGTDLDIFHFPDELNENEVPISLEELNESPYLNNTTAPQTYDSDSTQFNNLDFNRAFNDVELDLPGPEFDITAPFSLGSNVIGGGLTTNTNNDLDTDADDQDYQNNDDEDETDDDELTEAQRIEQSTPRKEDTESELPFGNYKIEQNGMVLKRLSNTSACRLTKNIRDVQFGTEQSKTAFAELLTAYKSNGFKDCP